MNNKRFMCIDIGYGDDCYITDNGERLSEMEIVNLLNEQDRKIKELANKYSNRETNITKAVDDILQNSYEIMNQRLSEENKCNYKKAIIEFCKFMNINSPLVEIMVDEFLQEVF